MNSNVKNIHIRNGITGKSLEHPCRPSSRDRLPVRPRGCTVASARPPSTGTALPHAHPVLLAAGHAGRTLHQLAAGPSGQLRGAAHVSRTGARTARRGRSRRRNGGVQPVRLFLEPSAEQFPFSYDDVERRELQPFLLAGDADVAVRELPATHQSPQATNH